MSKKQTAVEWLLEVLNDQQLLKNYPIEIIDRAYELERDQHGRTWDAAIKAHDDRGHVHARSVTDFDDYEIGS
jgi:hypothetical protein